MRLGWLFGPWVRLLMLTGARLNEGARAEIAEFDLAKRVWLMPGAKTKNGQPHVVPYPVELDENLDGAMLFEGCPYLFSTTGRTSISGLSKAKEQLDRLIASERATLAKSAGVEPKPIEHWTFHDFRRTVTMWCASQKVPPHIADKLLNHVTGEVSGVSAIYNRYEYLDERREALAAWGKHLGSCADAVAIRAGLAQP